MPVKMLTVIVRTFQSLSASEIYAILRLRSEVFVVEQNCVYQDLDNKDMEALHVCGYKNNTLVAYTRIFPPNTYFNNASIGRVAVLEKERKFGFGKEIMQASIAAIEKEFKTRTIHLSAQTYLKRFYNSLGFDAIGNEYLEDGIPHIGMRSTGDSGPVIS